MGFLFGKKETVQAKAEVLEDGREITNREMSRLKYNEYHGKEPMLEIGVRIEPDCQVPYEAKMKAGLSLTFLLVPGVWVQVKYEAGKKERVELDDTAQAILDRNPQLAKKE